MKCDGTRAETRFRLSAKRTSPFKSAVGVSSVDCWQASCAHQPAGFVLLVQACVLQSRDAYWLPTPFSCFPFTSPPVRHRVPSHFNWTLITQDPQLGVTVEQFSGHSEMAPPCPSASTYICARFSSVKNPHKNDSTVKH
jgi:hypothetical protein